MITRRKFLGLSIAAVIAGPAIAKSITEPEPDYVWTSPGAELFNLRGANVDYYEAQQYLDLHYPGPEWEEAMARSAKRIVESMEKSFADYMIRNVHLAIS